MQRPPRKFSTSTTPPQTKSRDLRSHKAEVDELVHKLTDLISNSPDKAGKVLEQWLQHDSKPERKKKTA